MLTTSLFPTLIDKKEYLLIEPPVTGNDTGKQYMIVINGANRNVTALASHPNNPKSTALPFGRTR